MSATISQLERYIDGDGQPRFTSWFAAPSVAEDAAANIRALEGRIHSLEEIIQGSTIRPGPETFNKVIEKCLDFFDEADASILGTNV